MATHFLESSNNLLLVEFVSDTLNSGQSLSAVSLLNSHMNKVAAQIDIGYIIVIGKSTCSFSEWIYSKVK